MDRALDEVMEVPVKRERVDSRSWSRMSKVSGVEGEESKAA